MYKSPIDIIQSTAYQVAKGVESDIYQAVFNYGIFVDKEELLKALRYDREQYSKGYEDGQKEARTQAHWIDHGSDIECSNCGFTCNDEYYLGNKVACPNCAALMNETAEHRLSVDELPYLKIMDVKKGRK